MPPNGAGDPTTAPEQMLEVRALLVSCITEGAIGVHRSSRSKAFEERCAPEVTTLKAMSYGRKLWMSPSHESAAYLPS